MLPVKKKSHLTADFYQLDILVDITAPLEWLMLKSLKVL